MKLRADDARIACPLFQAEYGGEVPTSALQLRIVKIARPTFVTLNRLWHSRLPEVGGACFMGQCYAAEFANLYYAVAWWSHPVNQNLCDDKTAELRRLAIAPDSPKNTASRMLSVMVRMIRKDRPEICRFVSYQDCAVHTGMIYKAAGWKSAGKTHQGAPCGWVNTSRVRTNANGEEVTKADRQRWDLILP